MTSPQGTTHSAAGRPVRPLSWLLNRIGNVWFGVTMLVIIFLYSSIGSAAPPLRQGAMADWFGLEFLRFEKTEMQWFSWWPFSVMLALFCLALVLVTLRRIRLSVVNAGVWMIHTGMIALAVSSAIYFARKVEGDAVIFQSRALILAPGMSEPASMVIRPGVAGSVGVGNRRYQIRVANIDPAYEILSGEDRGKKTQSIWLRIESTEPALSFFRVVLVGYPEYTEDVIPGADGPQRARKLTGKPLLDEDLDIQLAYDPAEHFYHSDRGAVYARFAASADWEQFRIEDLPRYIRIRQPRRPRVGRRGTDADPPAEPDADPRAGRTRDGRVQEHPPSRH